MRSISLPLSLVSLAIWLALTLGLGGTQQSLADAASGVGLPWLLAALFAVAVVMISQDRLVAGLGLPDSLLPVLPPLLYSALMLLLAWAGGLPPRATLMMVALNTALVAISEELMFRSILLQGFLSRYALLPAVLLSSLIFGLAHAANGFATGDLAGALWQSAAAAMQGVGYAAIRLRIRSIWPMVLVHALWDFSLMTATLAAAAEGETSVLPFAALLAVLPLCLYGLYLLRGARTPLQTVAAK